MKPLLTYHLTQMHNSVIYSVMVYHVEDVQSLTSY